MLCNRVMRPVLSALVAIGWLMGASVDGRAPAVLPAPESEYSAIERFLVEIEKPPVSYHARRRLDASSDKLQESAWLEAITEFDPAAGLRYQVVAEGGSERIRRRVLKSVLEAERETSIRGEWRKGNLSRSNYEFGYGGRVSEGILKLQLIPRRRDARLVLGSALVTAHSGDLVRVEGRLSKSPSFWVRWVNVSRSYSPIGGSMMPVGIESTADVRMAGLSKFSMTYDYQMVNGSPIPNP